MDELIARLEKATGPDRELDGRLWAEGDERDVREGECRYGRGLLAKSRRSPRDECVIGAWAENGSFMTVGQEPPLPRYTGSLDAARTLLISPRWFWRIDSHDPSAWVYLNIQDAFKGEGATPELSFCIAALKARQALTTSQARGG